MIFVQAGLASFDELLERGQVGRELGEIIRAVRLQPLD